EGNVGDAPVTATGSISISDVDDDDSPSFADVASTASDNGYGNFEITGNAWTYTLNNAHAAVQTLDVGETLNDTYTFTATDGSTQVVTVTINGAEDVSVANTNTLPVEHTLPDYRENEEPPSIPDNSTEDEADQPNDQQPVLKSTDPDEQNGSDGVTASNNAPDIGDVLDDLVHGSQEQQLDDSIENFDPKGKNTEHSKVKQADINRPETLVELMQLQAYQDQLANQSLLSDSDLEMTTEDEEELLNKLNEMREQIEQDLSAEDESQVEVQVALGSSVGLTVGFVNWILRGGSLLASMLSTMPLFSHFDPLPIIKSRNDDKKSDKDKEDDSKLKDESRVDELFSKNSKHDE
ncbi:MAG: hypothetical protein GY806_16465, partial [Gammaproteobacteria bacterium]|nr:hypothetical protein [Gammaproteobacteria bacterium]